MNKNEIDTLAHQIIKIKPSMRKEDVLTLSLKEIVSILVKNEKREERKKQKFQEISRLRYEFRHLISMCETDKYPELLNNLKIFIKQQVSSCTN